MSKRFNRYNYPPGSIRRNIASNAVFKKAFDHSLLKLRQLFCVHGDYVYLEVTTQKHQDNDSRYFVFARGCRKCAWICISSSYEGMPKSLEKSYDRVSLMIDKRNKKNNGNKSRKT